MDPAKLQELFRNVSELKRLLEALESIDKSVASIADKIGSMPDKVKELSGVARDSTKELSEGLEEATEQLDDLQESSEKMFAGWDKFAQNIKGTMQQIGDGIGLAAGKVDALGRGMQRLQTSPEAMIRGALNSMPFGGFFEMMLNTAMRNDAFSTAGRRSLIDFQQTGGGIGGPDQIRAQGEQLGRVMKDLEESFLGTKEEVQGVFQAMVEGGLKASQTVQHVDFRVAGFGQTVTEASLGLDKAFQLAAGSSMTFAASLTRTTGKDLPEMISLVKDLGIRTGETGMNMQSFVGTIVQASSALRVQGADAKALSGAYMNIQESFKRAMDPKVSQQRVSEMAAGALQGIAGFVSGMPEGMRGLIAKDVGKRMGVDTSHMKLSELMMHMETGFQFAPGRDVSKSFERESIISAWEHLKNMAPEDRAFALRKMGASPELAQALMQAGKAGNVETLFDFKAAKESEAKKLEEARAIQPLNTQDFTRMMESIRNTMFAIGEVMIGLLGIIATGIVNLPLAFNPLTAGAYGAKLGRASGRLGGAIQRVGKNIGELGAESAELGAMFANIDLTGGEAVSLEGTELVKHGAGRRTFKAPGRGGVERAKRVQAAQSQTLPALNLTTEPTSASAGGYNLRGRFVIDDISPEYQEPAGVIPPMSR